MEQPKFSIGQKVTRIVDGKGSTVLEVGNYMEPTGYFYYISYDEGETPGSHNEGKGWWPENSLQLMENL